LDEKAAIARACKQRKAQNPPVSTINDTASSSSSCLDDSLVLPINDPDSSDETESAPFSRNDAHEIYKEWSNCQSKDTVKMMAIVLMHTFIERFGLTNVAAATE